ncbi:MAG: extracellular matrix regulator RemB [Bacillota bacterium]
MFLHIGADASVATRDVIAIIDVKSLARSPATREFLSLAESERRVYRSGEGGFKSMVVTSTAVYLSPITPATLRRRLRARGFIYE